MIRADPTLGPDAPADFGEAVPAPSRLSARTSRTLAKAQETHAFPTPAAVPTWARASGRAGEDPLFAAGAGLALLDAFLRRDPPAAGALRARLALTSAAASAKLLRLNADAAALRDLRFAVTDAPAPALKLLKLWRDLGRRPPSLALDRIGAAAAALDLDVPDAAVLATTLAELSRAGDPLTAATRVAAALFAALPDATTAAAEILSHWAFDMSLAIRLRWPRPVPLLSTTILEPSLRASGGGRLKPDAPGWPKIAAGALGLAAASALDQAADLSCRAETLLAIAPKLRAKPAAKVVDLLLAED